MNTADLSDSDRSDSSDEDYNPNAKADNEELSEVDSDGDAESPLSGDDEEYEKKGRKRSKGTAKNSRKKIRKKDDPEAVDTKLTNTVDTSNEQPLNEEEKKKKDDDLWADFMKDTGFQSKSNKDSSNLKSSIDSSKKSTTVKPNSSNSENSADRKPNNSKVKITQVFEFAGEEVKVEKVVPADSAEARLLGGDSTTVPAAVSSVAKSSTNIGRPSSVKGGLSGIGSVLSQLGKKPKISTLEKSKLDWDKFKRDENIEEELQTHNKGKDGYLEKQDFLERADLRRFEIEREIRNAERSKRLNN